MTQLVITEPKKKGRKKKVVDETSVLTVTLTPSSSKKEKTPTKTAKKVNSKLHSAKIIESLASNMDTQLQKTNVILYLKCSMKELEGHINNHTSNLYTCTYNPDVPTDIKPFEPDNHRFQYYELNDSNMIETTNSSLHVEKISTLPVVTVKEPVTSENILKEKLKEIKTDFYKPDEEKCKGVKSACFWCTYPYDNETCHILQYSTKGKFLGHGSFCSPECSVAYLFNNCKWDDSAKMESYQLINYYYGEKDNYSKSIKPANCPFYFLEKFYGNMSIQEYRGLSKSQHMLLCVDKPVTRVLPEIHEDTESIMYNNTPSVQKKGNYKVKKQSDKAKQPSKNDILKDHFGVNS